MLPKGQFYLEEMPRFGLLQFANRMPTQTKGINITVTGDVKRTASFGENFKKLPRAIIKADFHCVTTWTVRDQVWEGVLFKDFYNLFVSEFVQPYSGAQFVVLYGKDGYRACMMLNDLMGDDIILADTHNDKPLSLDHGAPLRLVAPPHYGYKNVKHLTKLEFLVDDSHYRPAGLRFMEHPRARVSNEERGVGLPSWFLRLIYRSLIRSTINKFKQGAERYTGHTS